MSRELVSYGRRKRPRMASMSVSLGLGDHVEINAPVSSDDSDSASEFGGSAGSVSSLVSKSNKIGIHTNENTPCESAFGYSSDPTACWGCVHKFGVDSAKGKYPIVSELWAIYDENKDIPLEQVASMIEAYYEDRIVKPKVARGEKNIIIWTAKDILIHLTQHDIDSYRIVKHDIRNLVKLKNILDNNIVMGGGEINLAMVKSSLAVRQQMMSQIAALRTISKV